MDTIEDWELIHRFRSGDETALETLIQRYQEELYSFIFYKIKDENLANDFFQDTFIKIITTLKSGNYKERGKFFAWAKRIAHNLIIDYFRAKSRYYKISETSFPDEDFSIFDIIEEPSENIEELLINEQIQNDLYRMIDLLPQNQREVIELRYFKGLSFKEIAEDTDAGINTTLGRVRYALINLRKIMIENKISLTLE